MNEVKKVYLAGAINGCTDAECKEWREQVKTALAGKFIFLDPMRRDYRGQEKEAVKDIVIGDKLDICDCDIFLALAERPSWGTAMEIIYAHEHAKRVITICSLPNPSPWLVYHSDKMVIDVAGAIYALEQE